MQVCFNLKADSDFYLINTHNKTLWNVLDYYEAIVVSTSWLLKDSEVCTSCEWQYNAVGGWNVT